MCNSNWTKISVLSQPPVLKFMLVYAKFASVANPGATPQILKAYYDGTHDYWCTHYGKLRDGKVTHFMPLPDPPNDVE